MNLDVQDVENKENKQKKWEFGDPQPLAEGKWAAARRKRAGGGPSYASYHFFLAPSSLDCCHPVLFNKVVLVHLRHIIRKRWIRNVSP